MFADHQDEISSLFSHNAENYMLIQKHIQINKFYRIYSTVRSMCVFVYTGRFETLSKWKGKAGIQRGFENT